MIKKVVIILTLLISYFSVAAQNQQEWADSMMNAEHDSIRLRLCFQFSDRNSGRQRVSKFFALEALKFIDATQSSALKIKIIGNAANRCWEDGDYVKSITLQKAVLRIAEKNKMHSHIGSAFHSIGLNYYYTCDYDSALNYYKRAMREYELANDSVNISRLENHTAQVLDQIGDYIGVTEHLLRSMEMQERIPGFNNIAYDFSATTRMNDTIMLKARIEKSLIDLAYERSRGDSFKTAQMLRNIASDYTNVGEYNKALQYLHESKSYYESSGFTPFWLDFGFIFLVQEQYDSAFYYGNLWLKAQLVYGTRNAIAGSYAFKGLVYSRMNNFDSALSNYRKTLLLNEQMGNRIRIVENKLTIAKILISKNLNREALKLSEAALTIALEIKSIVKQAQCYELLTEIYRLLGLYDKALISHQKFYQLDKQIAKGEAHLAVAKLGLLYTISKREREIKDLNEKNLLTKSEIEARNRQILLAGIIILITVFGGWFYFRSYRNKKRMADLLTQQKDVIEVKNNELTRQNREKEVLLSEIHHRVKNNLQIISSLINLKAVKASNETSEVLYQLNGRIYSMGLIHERLYQKNEFQLIALDTYLVELSRYILDSFDETERNVELKATCEGLQIDVDTALTCGLIMNELLTNSLKYAFSKDQEHREIKVELGKIQNWLTLIIADNGNNAYELPENISRNFGLRFVDQLVKSKLNGDWSIDCGKGFSVKIKFPIQGVNHE
jgi:two-component system, sensor histidine kinase PdtaS